MTETERDRIAGIIGYQMARLVSRNPMPDMSGDPRRRIPEHERHRFDAACIAAADDILASLRSPPGEGWVMVPREPTEAMLRNTVDEERKLPRILDFTTPDERSLPFLMPRYIWRAMIAAAPLSPDRRREGMTERERIARIISPIMAHDNWQLALSTADDILASLRSPPGETP